MKKKMSLENRITLAQNNAIDFTHACMTIALHEMFGLGRERLEKVDKRKGAVSSAYRVQVEGARPKRYRIERERADAAKSAAYCHKVKEKPKPQPKAKERTPLQRDVHRMCLYNKAALKAGKKELQYGYWAAAGKPEKPVW